VGTLGHVPLSSALMRAGSMSTFSTLCAAAPRAGFLPTAVWLARPFEDDDDDDARPLLVLGSECIAFCRLDECDSAVSIVCFSGWTIFFFVL